MTTRFNAVSLQRADCTSLTHGVPPIKGNVSGPFEDKAEPDVISPVSLDLGLCGGWGSSV